MDQTNPYHAQTGREIRDALRDISPVAIAAVPIGLLFGAVAVGKGLSPVEVTLMSALVFAGGAQFAAIETWIYPVPVATIVFATFLINARHVLMGASFGPKFQAGHWQKFVGFYFMTDESWALAERRSLDRPVTPSYWFVMTVVLLLAWVVSSAGGAVLGSFLGDPSRLGADFAFTALFIGLIAGFGQSRVTLTTVAVSAAVSALTYVIAGSPWQVAAGALAGIGAAYIVAGEEARA